MSKAVLVMDMPERCSDCHYCNHKGYKNPCCALTNYANGYQSMTLEDIYRQRQSWCPLRELPGKDKTIERCNEYADGWIAGWNACLDAIEGKCDDE